MYNLVGGKIHTHIHRHIDTHNCHKSQDMLNVAGGKDEGLTGLKEGDVVLGNKWRKHI